jgi:hypothetical protein
MSAEPGWLQHALDAFSDDEDPYRADPVSWVEQRLGEQLWSTQREIAEAVRDHRYVAVPSCHDSGKSFLASRLVAWWISVHPPGEAFAVTTAPTTAQVEAILWREIRGAHAKGDLAGRLTLDARWYLAGEQLVAYGRKPQDYAATGFQGIHARHVLVVIDEACGVPRTLFDAVDSLATNEGARVLAIGNPDDGAAHFAAICQPGSGWHVIRINGLETPNFTDEHVSAEVSDLLLSPTWVDERRQRWGEASPVYRSKVLGEFPDVGEDTLIAPGLVLEAQARNLPPEGELQFGIDVARYGKDETTIYRANGGHVRLAWHGHAQDTMTTAGHVARLLRASGGAHAVVDEVGVGAGVLDRLAEMGLPVEGFNGGERPDDVEAFVNARAESYWRLREMFEQGAIDLDPVDEELAAQLCSIKWDVDSRGRVRVERKEDMRRRGLPSPDRADALAMALLEHATVVDVAAHKRGGSLNADILGMQW